MIPTKGEKVNASFQTVGFLHTSVEPTQGSLIFIISSPPRPDFAFHEKIRIAADKQPSKRSYSRSPYISRQLVLPGGGA